MDPEISIIWLANKRISEGFVECVEEVLRKNHISYEFVVVSRNFDKGKERVKRSTHSLDISDSALGIIMQRGFSAARGRYIITMGVADDLNVLDKMIKERKNADIVLASQYAHGRVNKFRNISIFLLNQFFAAVLSMEVTDFFSDFRMYNRNVLANLQFKKIRGKVLPKLLVVAYGQGWKILEIPYKKKKCIKQNVFSHARMLYHLWKVRNSVESPDYDNRAFNSLIPLQRYWQRKRYDIIIKNVPKQGKVVDIGCGSGRIIQDLPSAVAFDYALSKVKYLRRKGHRLAVNGAIQTLSFQDKSFDTVICSELIEHIPKEKRVFLELVRILKPGGVLIIGTPDYAKGTWRIIEWLYNSILPHAYAHEHISHYTRRSLSQILRQHGLQILRTQYVFNSEMILTAQKG